MFSNAICTPWHEVSFICQCNQKRIVFTFRLDVVYIHPDSEFGRLVGGRHPLAVAEGHPADPEAMVTNLKAHAKAAAFLALGKTPGLEASPAPPA